MELWIINAFSSRPDGGNPAAIGLLDREADAAWMQAIAAKMGLSETAFLLRQKDSYSLRWFTPACEVDLCGHATLAAAYYLWQTGENKDQEIVFQTRSGKLAARKDAGIIWLDLPADSPLPSVISPEIQAVLNKPVLEAWRGRFDLMLLLSGEEAVRSALIDLERIQSWDYRGIILTAASAGPEYDFVSRFFAPAAGIPEDPVTGSAHCLLGPFWQGKTGKDRLAAYQASKRGGTVQIRVLEKRVWLGGEACLAEKAEVR